MRVFQIAAVLFLLFVQAGYGRQPHTAFRGLKFYPVFKTAPNFVVIYYKGSLARILNKPDPYNPDLLLMRIKLSGRSKNCYLISYDNGPSEDPAFIFRKRLPDRKLKHIGELQGLKLYLPGNGNIYVSGHTNNYFDQRKKYKIIADKLIEIRQPYYHVGLKTVALKPIVLWADIGKKKRIARLPKGAKIEVLISKGEHCYLIKTPFGLTGWYILNGGCIDTAIKGLRYAGD